MSVLDKSVNHHIPIRDQLFYLLEAEGYNCRNALYVQNHFLFTKLISFPKEIPPVEVGITFSRTIQSPEEEIEFIVFPGKINTEKCFKVRANQWDMGLDWVRQTLKNI